VLSTPYLMTVTLTLPLPARGLRPNDRCHWAKKARLTKQAREAARREMFAAMKSVEAEVWIIASYSLRAYFKTKRHMDDDNIASGCKSYRDGIADAAGQDDKTFKCTGVQTFTDTKNPRLEILLEITELV